MRKEQTYREGIETLLVLRGKMMAELFRMKRELSEEEFSRMHFRYMKDKGVEEILRLFIEIMHLSSHILHLGSSHIDIQQNIR